MENFIERGGKNAKGGDSVKISPKLRVQIWELYIGMGIKHATCPLCGLNELQGPSQNSGFQACHIVASKFSPALSAPLSAGTSKGHSLYKGMDVFYLFPGCQTCNNECSEQCIFDFLYVRLRHKQLRAMIWNVFTTFSTIHEKELSEHEGICWRVLDHLYGPKRFPAGGGIENRHGIYSIANAMQMQHVQDEIKNLTERMSQRITLLNVLSCTEIKPFLI